MKKIDIAYLAGVMDSDGYFTIKKSTYNIRRFKDSKNPQYSEKCGIKQVQPQAVKFIYENFGGYYRIEKPSSKNGKPLNSISLTNRKAHIFIKTIYPYLRIKKSQAQILLKLRQSLNKGKTEKTRLPYFVNKKLLHNYNCKWEMSLSGKVILVPCFDIDNTLHGIQKINQNGSKYFQENQLINGTFHTIKKENTDIKNMEIIYICEGVSTGAAIFESIDRPVICAFNAGNLLSVAKVFKRKYPDKSIVICGDNDQHFTRPDGVKYNTGEDKAKKAAQSCNGTYVIPIFKNTENEPTDFNDLFIIESAETVKNQILNTKTENLKKIISLGSKEGTYYYTSTENNQIIKLKNNHNEEGLTSLVSDEEWWRNLYPKMSKEGTEYIVIGTDWNRARMDLKSQCHIRGLFNPDKIRSNGVYLHKKNPIVHCGDNLLINNELINLYDLKSSYIYTLGEKVNPPILKNELDTKNIIDIFTSISVKNPQHGKLLLGWTVTSIIAGALPWRPHIWLTGPSSAGKTYTMSNIVGKLLGPYCKRVMGNSTEAGIRQSLGQTSFPVIFDELETDDKKTGERVKNIIEFSRQASAKTKNTILRGTTSGTAISFSPNFSICAASINTNLVHQQDKNRWTIIEFSEKKKGLEQLKKVENLISTTFKHDISLQFFSYVYKNFGTLQENIKNIKKTLMETHQGHFPSQYSALLGGYALMVTDQVLNNTQIKHLIDSFDFQDQADDIGISDEQEIFDVFFNSFFMAQVGDSKEETTIKTLIERSEYIKDKNDSCAAKTLSLMGIRIINDLVYIHNNNNNLVNKIFKNTKWGKNYSRIMKRHFRAGNNENKTISINNVKIKCITIPLNSE